MKKLKLVNKLFVGNQKSVSLYFFLFCSYISYLFPQVNITLPLLARENGTIFKWNQTKFTAAVPAYDVWMLGNVCTHFVNILLRV